MSLPAYHPRRLGLVAAALAIGVAMVLAGSTLLDAKRNAKPQADTQWHEGAAGFTKGFEQALADDQPVLVYFYADWCGYCRQLESKLLDRPEVMESTRYLVKIRINPEHGPNELQLARRYGVAGYPAVFVHPAEPDARPKKISRMVVDGGKRRLMTPDEFVATLARASGETSG